MKSFVSIVCSGALACSMFTLAQAALASPCETQYRGLLEVMAKQQGKTMQQATDEVGGEQALHEGYLLFTAKIKERGLDGLHRGLENVKKSPKKDEARAMEPLFSCMIENYNKLEVPKPAAQKAAPKGK